MKDINADTNNKTLLFQGRMNTVLADPPSHFTVENSLATELLKLSFNDRSAIEEEIHGVRCLAVDETPELLGRSLREFDSELIARKKRGNPNPNKYLLRNVISISSIETSKALASGSKQPSSNCYLNDPNVRLRFLRCECFDVPKAVQRLLNFLEFTSELFGDFVAERPIRLSDFDTKKEESALHNTRYQYLPFRDRSGRRVLAAVGSCNYHLDIALRYKILMYLHWVVSEDIESQRKGVVIIAFPSNEEEYGEASWEKIIRPGMKDQLRIYQKKHADAMTVRFTRYVTKIVGHSIQCQRI